VDEEATGGDDFAANPAVFDLAPASSFEGGVDEFGVGFGFVHGAVDSVCWAIECVYCNCLHGVETHFRRGKPILMFSLPIVSIDFCLWLVLR
jgi:hypothetical protein